MEEEYRGWNVQPNEDSDGFEASKGDHPLIIAPTTQQVKEVIDWYEDS